MEHQLQKPAARLKRCSRCGEEKPTEEFYRHNSTADGLRSSCKSCHRGYNAANRHKFVDQNRRRALLRFYGMSTEQYEALYEAQGGKCAICDCDPAEVYARNANKAMTLQVDHDHHQCESGQCVDGECGGGEPICTPSCQGSCFCAEQGDGPGTLCVNCASVSCRVVTSCLDCPPDEVCFVDPVLGDLNCARRDLCAA